MHSLVSTASLSLAFFNAASAFWTKFPLASQLFLSQVEPIPLSHLAAMGDLAILKTLFQVEFGYFDAHGESSLQHVLQTFSTVSQVLQATGWCLQIVHWLRVV